MSQNESNFFPNAVEEQAILAWLQQNALPIQHDTVGNGFADLQPLNEILRDVKVVALGEATHGTHEIYTLKHRLVEFLVSEMGFTNFTLEGSTAGCTAINDYVLFGSGDLAEVLSNQGYMCWDTEEFTAMLRWMRAHNESAPEEKKIRFWGNDIWRNDLGRAAVLEYLRRVAPEKLAEVSVLFETAAVEEVKWPFPIDEDTVKVYGQLSKSLQTVIDDFRANRDAYIRCSSATEYLQIFHLLEVMQQLFLVPKPLEGGQRSKFISENLIHRIEQSPPGGKFIFWAHNYHIKMGDFGSQENSAGYFLRKNYGKEYYALSLHLHLGAFLAREFGENGYPGAYHHVALPAVPDRSFPWVLSHTRLSKFMINLRHPVVDPVVERWIESENTEIMGEQIEKMRFSENYDGIVFIERTTPSHPTANTIAHSNIRNGGFF